MTQKQHVAVWYDREGDFLEVMFEQKEGYFRETAHDQVMEKVDKNGAILGFHVALHKKSGQKSDAAVNEDFLVSF